jgi:hypothetical protein
MDGSRVRERTAMIYCFLILCAFAEGFLLWVLVALIQESRHLAPQAGKGDRMRRRPQ